MTIEQQAVRVRKQKRLSTRYTVGARKAFVNFQKFYGAAEGRRIFVLKAIEQGQGADLKSKIDSVYRKRRRGG